MSEKQIWKCDRCGETWTSDDCSVSPLRSIVICEERQRQYGDVSHPDWEAEWCHPCLLATGVCKPDKQSKLDAGEQPEHLSLEEMIREIVREIVCEEIEESDG